MDGSLIATVRPWAPGFHHITEPFMLQSNTEYDLTGVTLFVPGEARPVCVLQGRDIVNTRIIGGVLNGNIQGSGTWTPGLWPNHETQHLIMLEGARDTWIQGTRFHNPRGDGLLLYRVPGGPGCSGIKLLDFEMLGGSNNRNGVSIVHARDVEIARGLLQGMSRPDMPGAIDLEPNYPDEELGNIWIHHLTIDRGAAHGIQLWNGAAHTRWIDQVLIEDVSIVGGRKRGIWMYGSPSVTEGLVTIRRCRVRDASTPYLAEHMTVNAYDNDFRKKRRRRR